MLFVSNAFCQIEKTVSFTEDKIFSEKGRMIGKWKLTDEIFSVDFISREDKVRYFAIVESELSKKCSWCTVSFNVNEFVFDEPIVFIENDINYRGQKIGNTAISTNNEGFQVVAIITTKYFDKEKYEYVKEEMKANFRDKLKGRGLRVNYQVLSDFSEENEKERLRKEKQRAEEELSRQKRLAKERLKREKEIQVFKSMVNEELKNSSDPLVGVYKSIEDDNSTEYEIALIQSKVDINTYIACVLDVQNNSNVTVGSVLFKLIKTAQPNVYFSQYNRVTELSYSSHFTETIVHERNNAIATLQGAILQTPFCSFVKTLLPLQTVAAEKPDYISQGSGFFINKDGYIATNHHVIDKAQRIQIEYIKDGFRNIYSADIVASDPKNDLAILKINEPVFKPFSSLPYGCSENVSDVGTSVFALGYPEAFSLLGTEVKFTDGKISAKTGFQGDPTLYQISVPIHHGSSGGALFDEYGNLIGITSAGIGRLDLVNYAIKTNYLINLAKVSSEQISISAPKTILMTKPLTEKIKILSEYMVLITILE